MTVNDMKRTLRHTVLSGLRHSRSSIRWRPPVSSVPGAQAVLDHFRRGQVQDGTAASFWFCRAAYTGLRSL